jgi:hypothetical protein
MIKVGGRNMLVATLNIIKLHIYALVGYFSQVMIPKLYYSVRMCGVDSQLQSVIFAHTTSINFYEQACCFMEGVGSKRLRMFTLNVTVPSEVWPPHRIIIGAGSEHHSSLF